MEWLLILIVACIFAPPILRGFKAGLAGKDGTMICPHCGTRGEGKQVTRGSFTIELVLWLCLIIPGLIYTLWRLTTTTQNTCPACGQGGMIPISTPRGQAMAKEFSGKSAQPQSNLPEWSSRPK